jgi:haloalkane dehalogenase
MNVLRTPDERFENLPDWPYEPRYAEVPDGEPGDGTLRVHYVDEGPDDASPILLLHGEPSWAYLYRHMIPILTGAGHRVVVPDQVGFGRSDKPAETTDYSYARHVAWMSSLAFDHLDLHDMTFFGQDWGGLIGLRLVTAQPERLARVAVSNTGLPTGDFRPSQAFLDWQKFSQTTPDFPVGGVLNGGTLTDLPADVIAAYDAPFPDDSYKSGARIWPSLVPTSPNDPEAPANREAWEILKTFDRPFQCCFSDSDPVTAGGDKPFLKLVPGAAGQSHTVIEGAGHFVQEDKGPELARLLIGFIGHQSD